MNKRNLKLKQGQAKFDLVSLGEVMIRFDPGDTRIRNARSFQVWEGGGEYNVARGLHTCFGKNTAIATALVDNEIGKLVKGLITSGGTDTSLVKWLPDDGIGRSARNGVYYLEKGFGKRAALGASDRGHTAISKMNPKDIDWEDLFGNQGVRWFHTGGIFAGLSDTAPEVIIHAADIARQYGTIVSYDLNYRPSLWQERGGKAAADKVNSDILEQVDVLFGVDSLETNPVSLDYPLFEKAIGVLADRYPNLKAIASTMRIVQSANVNDWSGVLWIDDTFYRGMQYRNLDIYDRVGGGDGFASGVIYGLLNSLPHDETINHGIAHGALVMGTPGDNSMVDQNEVRQLIHKQDATVMR